MKKIYIFGIFLLIFSFFITFSPNGAHAKIDGFNAQITYFYAESPLHASGTPDGIIQENSPSKEIAYDYSAFCSGGEIYLIASLEADQESTNTVGPIYKWTINKEVVSTSNKLTLYSNLSCNSSLQTLIKVGTTNIKLSISDTNSSQSSSIEIKLRITDNNNLLNMKYAQEELPTDNPDIKNLHFRANIPTTSKLTAYKWQLKIPNTTGYVTVSNDEHYIFETSNIFSKYGFGTYKIMAVGEFTENNTIKRYYSSIISLSPIPDKNIKIDSDGVELVKEKIKNSITNIEAFKYHIQSTSNSGIVENLIPENVHWYVDGYKTATGLTFIYEPTTRQRYSIQVKYVKDGEENPIVLVALTDQPTPKTTQYYYMYITIGAVVLVLVLILVITLKVTNKKRDVVW